MDSCFSCFKPSELMHKSTKSSRKSRLTSELSINGGRQNRTPTQNPWFWVFTHSRVWACPNGLWTEFIHLCYICACESWFSLRVQQAWNSPIHGSLCHSLEVRTRGKRTFVEESLVKVLSLKERKEFLRSRDCSYLSCIALDVVYKLPWIHDYNTIII